MARRTTVLLQDDLDGSTATQTIRFGYKGADYEIDLNDDNAKEMILLLENYISHARRVGGVKREARSNGYASKADPKLVRQWAATEGIAVGPRGRIPSQIQEQYLASVGG